MSTVEQVSAKNKTIKPRVNSFWLKMSIVFGLLPILILYFSDYLPDYELFQLFFFGLLLSPLVVCVVAAIQIKGWWKLTPIFFLVLNLSILLFVYALHQWANS